MGGEQRGSGHQGSPMLVSTVCGDDRMLPFLALVEHSQGLGDSVVCGSWFTHRQIHTHICTRTHTLLYDEFVSAFTSGCRCEYVQEKWRVMAVLGRGCCGGMWRNTSRSRITLIH